LLYYNARYYDSARGTFLSPDTLVPDAGVLFDYNRYMYVRGNPLKYTDPTGHFVEDDIPHLCAGCTSWDDVWAFFNITEEWQKSFFQDEFITFGSLVMTGNSTGATGSYTLVLQEKKPTNIRYYTLAVWDNNSQSFSDMSAILSSSHFAVWYTNSRADTGGYKVVFTRGWDSGSAIENTQPWQNGFSDLKHTIVPPKGLRYGVYTDWNELFLVSLVTDLWGLVVVGSQVARDGSSAYIDKRYPTVEQTDIPFRRRSSGGAPRAYPSPNTIWHW
jgi:hypothetical protein